MSTSPPIPGDWVRMRHGEKEWHGVITRYLENESIEVHEFQGINGVHWPVYMAADGEIKVSRWQPSGCLPQLWTCPNSLVISSMARGQQGLWTLPESAVMTPYVVVEAIPQPPRNTWVPFGRLQGFRKLKVYILTPLHIYPNPNPYLRSRICTLTQGRILIPKDSLVLSLYIYYRNHSTYTYPLLYISQPLHRRCACRALVPISLPIYIYILTTLYSRAPLSQSQHKILVHIMIHLLFLRHDIRFNFSDYKLIKLINETSFLVQCTRSYA